MIGCVFELLMIEKLIESLGTATVFACVKEVLDWHRRALSSHHPAFKRLQSKA